MFIEKEWKWMWKRELNNHVTARLNSIQNISYHTLQMSKFRTELEC